MKFRNTHTKHHLQGKPPKFRGKAANTRHLVPFAVKLCQKLGNTTNHDKFRWECVSAFYEFYKLLDRQPRTMSQDALADLSMIGRRVCSYYSALSSLSQDMCWHMTPKFHLLLHLVDWQAPLWGNPNFFRCYCDEDMIGHMVEVAGSCHAATMSELALFKSALCQSLQ